MKKVKRHGVCHTCMWWWDLYDTGEHKCYMIDSKHYHECTKNGCRHHENLLRVRNAIALGTYKDGK